MMDNTKLAELLFPGVVKTPEQVISEYPERALPQGAVVSRMAPSPTGFVHLGNLVQGITSERMTHQTGGVLFLRIEDTDSKREVKGAVDVLTESLKYYGIEFDEGAMPGGDVGAYGPYTQSKRRDIYAVFATKMVREGHAYPCFCSEEDLADMKRRQEEAGEDSIGYFGKWAACRDMSYEEIEKRILRGDKWVLRYRSTGDLSKKIKFTDMVKGEVELTENIMDFVLLKSDGIPTYHFAHAVDDSLMHTTHVVRGDEWLPSLPFHIQLFRDLGFRLPKYLHIGPLMKMDGESKRKLSKRKDPELAMKLTPPSLSSYDQKTGRIVYEDMTALHDRQTMSLWGFTDWQWLFNLRALVKTVYKSPTIPLLSRLVSGWRIPQQLPQMPCLASWLDWLVIWVGNEFMTRESDCSFAGEDAWKKDVLASVVANRLSGVLLLGLGVQTTSQYKSARTEPTANVLRLAWISEHSQRHSRSHQHRIIDTVSKHRHAVLRDIADPLCQLSLFEGADIFAVQQYFSLIAAVSSEDAAKQGAFSNAVWTQQTHQFSGLHRKADLPQHRFSVVSKTQLIYL